MRQVARRPSSGACKRGGAVRLAGAYGRLQRLIIESRYFERSVLHYTFCSCDFARCLSARPRKLLTAFDG
jgi:hypothetical protein